MTAATTSPTKFDIARVIQRTFSAISGNWLVFLVSSVLFVGIPSLLQALGGGGNFVTSRSSGQWGLVVVGFILSVIGAFLLQGTIVVTTINGLNGKRMDVPQALSAGLRFFFPLFGLAVLMGLALALGFVLLVVPGIILSILWIVAAPVLVVEKRGIVESFGRSRALTRGHRWMIFLLMLIYGIASWIIGIVVVGFGAAAAGGLSNAATGINPIMLVVSPLASVIGAVISSAGVAAIYYELRNIKEGVAPEQLASVFD